MGKKTGKPPGKSGPSKFNPGLNSKIKTERKAKEEKHILKDDRFSKIATDPRFRGIPAQERKVQIDNRFQSMFTDKNFNQKHSVDKRGRPVNFASADNLERFYEIGDNKPESSSSKPQGKKSLTSSGKKNGGNSGTADERFQKFNGDAESSESESEDEEDEKSGRDLARGKGNVSSSSDEESSDDDEELDGDAPKIEHPWAELANDAGETKEISSRLALVNMDWDNISAEDIFALMNSFKPLGGTVKSVAIYLSDYGAERLEEEKIHGPIKLAESAKKSDDEDEEEDDFNKEDFADANEKLRQYQLSKLRYYYAVVECDSKTTADKIYEECNDLEYGNSSARVDLRFIPDDMTFDREPKSIVTGLPANFAPKEFVITALQQSKVSCSWDETARDRLKLNKLDWTKADDLKEFLASSSEDEEIEEDVNDAGFDNRSLRSAKDPELMEKYRSLILEIDEKSKKKAEDESDEDIDMEVEWKPELKTSAAERAKQKEKLDEKQALTPFEKQLEKQKQKRMEKKNMKKDKEVTLEEAWANDESDDLEDSDDEDESDQEDSSGDEKAKRLPALSDDDEDTAPADKPASKEDLELLVGKFDGKNHFNLKKLMNDAKDTKSQRKKKRKRRPEEATDNVDDFEINLRDPRFSALFTSSQYNLDLSDPSFKRTKVMDAIVGEKQKRRKDVDASEPLPVSVPAGQKLRPELAVITKSVKVKFASKKQQ